MQNKTSNISICNSAIGDIDEIFRLYEIATNLQKSKFYIHWPKFEKGLIETEIFQKRQWKIVIDGEIACIWATTFDDVMIWQERNKEPSVYIHRIAINPNFKGFGFVKIIIDWAEKYAKSHQKEYIRMDTVGENIRLIEHYQKCGFNYLGYFKLNSTNSLPEHYSLADVCLFEIKLY